MAHADPPPLSRERKTAGLILLGVFFFSLGLSLTVNLRSLQGNFLFADEAIYFSLTQSIAHDYDLEYTKKDLYRYFRDMESEPLGIFLKRGKGGKIFFGKSFAYPLFAAPFVRIFGINGFLVFHACLLGLLLWMGYAILARANGPALAAGAVLTFLFASVAAVYFLWISPDFFSLVLAFSVLFLWLYKHQPGDIARAESRGGRLQAFLLSNGSDYLAVALAGIAVFVKPPNIALMGPILLHTLISKKILKSAGLILVFLASTAAFWGANHAVTGDWNYQGGERKTFYNTYPFERDGVTFDTAGHVMTADNYGGKFLLPAKFIPYNLFYYFFGRFTGLHWYFFPAFLALVLFLRRKKSLIQWMLFAALAGEILIYVILMPDNYAGGGGALGNRYFMNIYPLFFFLPEVNRKPREIAACWIVAALFIGQILISPLRHSHYPATHVKKFPFSRLPVELTLTNNFPTNTNPRAFRQPMDHPPEDGGWIHFLDDNFHPRQEPTGFWTKGPETADMVIKTWHPVERMTFRLLNNPRLSNTITVKVWGEKKTVTLGPNQWGKLEFVPKKVFRMESNHLYRVSIKADKGAIPFFEQPENLERRHLGVFFEIDFELR